MDHRAISPIEMYSVGRHCLDFYQSVVFYLRFQTSTFCLMEWKERIETSLRLVVEAQPRLRLQVDLSRQKPYFVILPVDAFDTLPIKIVQRIDDDHDDAEEFLDKTLEIETNTAFNYDGVSPLWRVTLIVSSRSETFDLILALNHAIADGISGMAFFTTLVKCLSNKPTVTYPLTDDRPLHELIPSKMPPVSSLLAAIVEKVLLPSFLSKYFFPKTYWTGPLDRHADENDRTSLLSFKLSSELLDSLHRKCHEEMTTIHTAVLASLLLSIIDTIGKRNTEFYCNSAVNVRRWCQPTIPNERMGVFVSSADSYHYVPYRDDPSNVFWPLARQIKEQINEDIDRNVLPLIQSLRFISDWNEFLVNRRKTLPNGYQHSIDISNILRWSFQSDDPSWKILHGGFTQSANAIGSVFTVSVVTVNSVLKVYISFHRRTIGTIDQAKLMINRMRRLLVEIAST